VEINNEYLKYIMDESNKIVQKQEQIRQVQEQAPISKPINTDNTIIKEILERVSTIDRQLYEIKDLMRRL